MIPPLWFALGNVAGGPFLFAPGLARRDAIGFAKGPFYCAEQFLGFRWFREKCHGAVGHGNPLSAFVGSPAAKYDGHVVIRLVEAFLQCQSVDFGHSDIEDDTLRPPVPLTLDERLNRAVRLSAVAALPEESAKDFTKRRVIVHYGNHRGSITGKIGHQRKKAKESLLGRSNGRALLG
ncbi:MAG: hypothetical protein ABIQ12_04015 [Opitutaceae bacterium]